MYGIVSYAIPQMGHDSTILAAKVESQQYAVTYTYPRLAKRLSGYDTLTQGIKSALHLDRSAMYRAG